MNARSTRLTLALAMPLAAWAAIPLPAAADSVTDWNAITVQSFPAYGAAPQRAYLGAMVHIAIHDALNSIDARYERYSVLPAAPAGASPDAAVAAAARDVLIHELNRAPDSSAKAAARDAVEAAYASALSNIPDGAAENQGVAAGQAAAAAIVAARANDGSATPNLPYTLAPGPGVYQSTPPNFPMPAFAGWALVKPFALIDASQFRADPSAVLDLGSSTYARDYNEVKTLGDAAVRSANPDSEESRIARYWPGGGEELNDVTRELVAGQGLDRWQHARLFALLNIARADGAISVFDTKYTYNFWRPVTAIRWADDGNPATAPDPAWLPYLTTPPYPDYTCGLPTLVGAGLEVLRRYYGTDDIAYTFTAAGVTRTFTSLSQAGKEVAAARVYAGIHFRSGCEQGLRHGAQVGRFAFQHYLRPVRH